MVTAYVRRSAEVVRRFQAVFAEAGRADDVVLVLAGQFSWMDTLLTAAARAGIPCITTIPGVLAAVQGIEAARAGGCGVRSLQEYHAAVTRAPAAASPQVQGQMIGEIA